MSSQIGGKTCHYIVLVTLFFDPPLSLPSLGVEAKKMYFTTSEDAAPLSARQTSISSLAAARRLQRSHEKYPDKPSSSAPVITKQPPYNLVEIPQTPTAQQTALQPVRRAPTFAQPAVILGPHPRPEPSEAEYVRFGARPKTLQPAASSHSTPLPQRLPPQPPIASMETPAVCGQCDKCDGPHATDCCPHFKKAREKHRDAWESYTPPNLEASNGDGAIVATKAKRLVEEAAAAAARMLRGATVVKQPGDGSCLFHSLAYGARQLPVLGVADVELSTAEGVRARVLRFLESHPAEECAGVPLRDWVLWESKLEPVAYCSRMRQPGAWGGAIEMLCFSRVANASVRVYERKGDGFEQISAFDVEQQTGSAERLVRVLYSGRSHYDALTVSV